MDRDRAVENGARRRRALHGARQPSGERDLRGLAGSGQQERKRDRPAPGLPRAMAVRPRMTPFRPSGAWRRQPPAIRCRRRDRRRKPEAVLHRGRALLEESDQQHRSDAHQSPTRRRAGRTNRRRKRAVTRTRKGAAKQRTGKSHVRDEDRWPRTGRSSPESTTVIARKRQRETVGHQYKGEAVIVHSKPVPECHTIGEITAGRESPKQVQRRDEQRRAEKVRARNPVTRRVPPEPNPTATSAASRTKTTPGAKTTKTR